MAESFNLESVWGNDHFTIKKGVLRPKIEYSGLDLGQGVVYYSGAERIMHRIAATPGDEIIIDETELNKRCLWNAGHLTEIVNCSVNPESLFLVKLHYNPLLAGSLSNEEDVAEAVAYLLHGPWPEAFKSSVQVDLKVIGDLGAANLRTPAVRNRAILRATRAKEDLEFKIAWVAAAARESARRGGMSSYGLRFFDFINLRRPTDTAPPYDGMVQVTVNTKDSDGTHDVKGYVVWATPNGGAHDPSLADRFDELSTPTKKFLPVGGYAMWAQMGPSKSDPVRIAVGSLEKPLLAEQTVDLVVP